jgi:hypothetical protein
LNGSLAAEVVGQETDKEETQDYPSIITRYDGPIVISQCTKQAIIWLGKEPYPRTVALGLKKEMKPS